MTFTMVRFLEEQVSLFATESYPDLVGPLRVTRVGQARHTSSSIHRFRVHGANGLHRDVIGKVGTLREDGLPGRTHPQERLRLEYEGLRLIADAFADADPARFGTVRPLGIDEKGPTLVLEAVDDPSLKTLIGRANRLSIRSTRNDLPEIMQNLGAWLRRFHSIPAPDVAVERATDVAALRTSVLASLQYLEESGAIDDVAALRAPLEAAIARLQDPFRLALNHGDLAPRNVLVGPGSRVTVIDTQCRWLMPVYEDLAYFRVGLWTIWPMIVTQGNFFDGAFLDDVEDQFLAGYACSDEDRRVCRVFEQKILLLRWAAKVRRSAQKAAGGRPLSRLEHAAMNRYFWKLAHTTFAV